MTIYLDSLVIVRKQFGPNRMLDAIFIEYDMNHTHFVTLAITSANHVYVTNKIGFESFKLKWPIWVQSIS